MIKCNWEKFICVRADHKRRKRSKKKKEDKYLKN